MVVDHYRVTFQSECRDNRVLSEYQQVEGFFDVATGFLGYDFHMVFIVDPDKDIVLIVAEDSSGIRPVPINA